MESTGRGEKRLAVLGEGIVLTIAGVLVALGLLELTRAVVVDTGIRDSTMFRLFVNKQAQAGFLIVTLGYLGASSAPRRYLQFRVPSASDVGWLLALLVLVPVTSAPDADWWLTEALRTTPLVWVLVVVGWLLLAAPAEELLFRGIIQRRLTDRFRAPIGMLVAAGLFSLMHVLFATYVGRNGIPSLAVVTFVMGAVFGLVYDRTNNLVVPALGHGVYWLSPALLSYI